ncbi:MAG: D-glycero-beta-D-manno-heptose 1,7-bisphosphate 7-phosphatase [Promethearchaeota archaeon]
MRRAVFLDRDGVINEEVNYLHEVAKLRIIPGVPGALKTMHELGFLLVVVTNQSGIGRGYYKREDAEAVHAAIQDRLRERGVLVDAFYICPHTPEDDCECRKPKPGMILKASEDFGIDASSSYMIGDKLTDLKAGKSAGCKTILVRTGYGKEEEKLVGELGIEYIDFVLDDLRECARFLSNEQGKKDGLE